MLSTFTELSLESLLGNNRNVAFWVVLFLLIVVLFNVFSSGAGTMQTREISYSDFVKSVRGGTVSSATLDGEQVRIVTTDNSEFVTINGLVKTPGIYAIINNKYSLDLILKVYQCLW